MATNDRNSEHRKIATADDVIRGEILITLPRPVEASDGMEVSLYVNEFVAQGALFNNCRILGAYTNA